MAVVIIGNGYKDEILPENLKNLKREHYLPNKYMNNRKLLGNYLIDLLPNNIYNLPTLLGKGQT
jgi:hypothetical protein